MGHYYDCVICGYEKGAGGCRCPKEEQVATDREIKDAMAKNAAYIVHLEQENEALKKAAGNLLEALDTILQNHTAGYRVTVANEQMLRRVTAEHGHLAPKGGPG